MTPTVTAKAARQPRRTQRQRRDATVAKLIDGAITALTELGFVRATVKEICARAGVSDGGMFRHFDTRLDLIIAAAESIAQRTAGDIEHRVATAEVGDQALPVVIAVLRESARSSGNRVWHELLAAARTDDELRRRLEPTTRRYIHDVRRCVARLPGMDAIPPEQFDLWLPLLIHLFDGEAIFSIVAPNPQAEDRLLDFVTNRLLTDAVARPASTKDLTHTPTRLRDRGFGLT
jgi:AcrR family transcriptional regulator